MTDREEIRAVVESVLQAHEKERQEWNWRPSGIELFTRRTRQRRPLVDEEDPKPYHPALDELSERAGVLAADYVCSQLDPQPSAYRQVRTLDEMVDHIAANAENWTRAERGYREALEQHQRKRTP